jgi:tetratricopeptide (TPR) repeat protein
MRAVGRTASACTFVLALGVASQSHAQTVHATKPTPSPSADTADVDAARTHFKLGIDSYRDSDLPTALIEFKRAYAASPNYRLLYNLGQVCEELRDYPEADRYFKQYLRDGAGEIDTARKQQVETELAKIKLRIASLVLSTNLANAEWFVDDVPSGHSPLSDVVRVSAGRHRISATIGGRPRVTKVIDAAGGETQVVEVAFSLQPENVAAAAPAQRDQAPAPAAASGPSPALWVGIGTGLLAVGAGVTGYLAYRDSANYKDAIQRPTTSAELDSLSQSAKTKALVTDVLLGATAVGAAVTLYLVLDSSGSERDTRASLRVGPGALLLTQRF